jgi:hypothetical protein
MCCINSVETEKGILVSWITTKDRTFLFRQPNLNYLEMVTLKEKVSDFGNHLNFLKSNYLREELQALSQKSALVFECQDGFYKWNNILKY